MKPLSKRIDNLQTLAASTLLLYGSVTAIPQPLRRQLKARLKEVRVEMLKLRKQVNGY